QRVPRQSRGLCLKVLIRNARTSVPRSQLALRARTCRQRGDGLRIRAQPLPGESGRGPRRRQSEVRRQPVAARRPAARLGDRVAASSWEGWWYEGAGIYRHVWLVKTAPLHVAPNGTFITSKVGKAGATVTVRTTVVNNSHEAATFRVISSVRDGGKTVATARS